MTVYCILNYFNDFDKLSDTGKLAQIIIILNQVVSLEDGREGHW